MKITKKLIKIQHSVGLIIDKKYLEEMKLKLGDFVELDIKKSRKRQKIKRRKKR